MSVAVKDIMRCCSTAVLLFFVTIRTAFADDYLADGAHFTNSFLDGFKDMLPNLTLFAGVILLLMSADKFKKYRDNKCSNSLSVPLLYLAFGMLLVAYRWL